MGGLVAQLRTLLHTKFVAEQTRQDLMISHDEAKRLVCERRAATDEIERLDRELVETQHCCPWGADHKRAKLEGLEVPLCSSIRKRPPRPCGRGAGPIPSNSPCL